MEILTLVTIALVGEAVWETCKMIWEEGKISVDRIGAIIVSLLLAFGAQLDLFELVGMPLVIPYVGIFLTGLLISRGANFLHDLYRKVQQPKG